MNIQIITGNNNLTQEKNIVISNYSRPSAMDGFDINVIDLSYNDIWYNDGEKKGELNIGNDIASIKHMANYSTKARILYVYPQNGLYFFDYYNGDYYEKLRIRDVFADPNAYDKLENYFFSNIDKSNLICESTKTIVGDETYEADFHFTATDKDIVVTKSNKSDKATTIRYGENLYITTLNVCTSNESIKNFINSLFTEKNDENIPEWVKQYNFGNDIEERELIEKNTEAIKSLKNCINEANKQLEANNKYKSILCSSGDKLVEVVFEILEIILDHDLKDFIDKKEEDFLIEKDDIILIGEIKGVSSNVKNEHVSQLDVHYNKYIDDHESIDKNICALLIINPFRDIDLSMRETINEQQVSLAKRNGSLIIETKTLLKIFEMFNDGLMSTENIIKIFKNNTGLLKESDLSKFTNS